MAPLGIADSLGCTASRAELDPGEGLLLYTDGLTEARRTAAGDGGGFELFGEARVERLIADLGPSRPEEVLFSVRRAVNEFSGGQLADDLCMVALRRNARSRTTAL